MPPKTAAIPHIGRKIEKLRTIKGIKQDVLAAQIGISQSALSKIEQNAIVDEEKLKLIADALEMNVEAIKSFDEHAFVNLINNIHSNNFDNNSIAFVYQFNPVEKISELYERLLESEQQKVKMLEDILKSQSNKQES